MNSVDDNATNGIGQVPHKPGPWEIGQYENITAGGETLLMCGVALPSSNHPQRAEAEANTRLAVAAPAMELLLHGAQLGVVNFYHVTGEVRFGGLMYSASDRDWNKIVSMIGWDKLRAAIARANGGGAC